MTICICGTPIIAHEGKGRTRRYCSDACKVKAFRRKHDGCNENASPPISLQPRREIKPILKYPGGKWQLARWITSFFPEHKRYVEPYCGSAAVFFNKAPVVHEVINDTNKSIVNLFQVIREHGAELAWRIEMSPWSESEYHAVEKHYDDSGDPIEDARRFLMRSWQAHGGTIYQVSGWKHNGLNGKVYPVTLWKKLPERLLAAVDRLKDAEIRDRPALEMVRYYNTPDTLLYVDPPYMLSTRSRKYYKFEMSDEDHHALVSVQDAHQGMVVLSGYAHPLYDERLKHWYRVETPSVTEHGNTRMEVLWLNPRAANRQQLSLFDVV